MPLGNGNDVFVGSFSGAPTTADVFSFRVKFADGTTQDITASPVSPILGAPALPTTPVVNVSTPYSRTVPRFEWGVPVTPPVSYEYFINVGPNSGGQSWGYPDNGIGMPSSQRNVVYNVDGHANPSSLVSGTPYRWQVTVRDLVTRNSATFQAPIYTP
jgi:hypothetical protein